MASAVLLADIWWTWDSHPSLPRYELEVHGGQALSLGQPAVATLRPDSLLRITLRPVRRVTRPVPVCAFLRHGGDFMMWSVVPEHRETGVLRLQGTAGELLPYPAGRYELHFLVDCQGIPGLLQRLAGRPLPFLATQFSQHLVAPGPIDLL